MNQLLRPGVVVYFTAPSRSGWVGVVLNYRRREAGLYYTVKPYKPETRTHTPAGADLLYLPGELFVAADGKRLSLKASQIKPTRHNVQVTASMKKRTPAKARKTAATPSKRKMTAKGRTYLEKLHTLTKSIHKASDTGETKVQKVYGLSWSQAQKQAIRKLKKK